MHTPYIFRSRFLHINKYICKIFLSFFYIYLREDLKFAAAQIALLLIFIFIFLSFCFPFFCSFTLSPCVSRSVSTLLQSTATQISERKKEERKKKKRGRDAASRVLQRLPQQRHEQCAVAISIHLQPGPGRWRAGAGGGGNLREPGPHHHDRYCLFSDRSCTDELLNDLQAGQSVCAGARMAMFPCVTSPSPTGLHSGLSLADGDSPPGDGILGQLPEAAAVVQRRVADPAGARGRRRRRPAAGGHSE